jgi:hypothetical protein
LKDIKMKKKILNIPLIAISLLAGCASTGVVPADKGTFLISKQSAAGVFGTPDGVRADIYVEANAFCERTGKAVETVNIEVKGAIPFVRTGSALLQFKCVNP